MPAAGHWPLLLLVLATRGPTRQQLYLSIGPSPQREAESALLGLSMAAWQRPTAHLKHCQLQLFPAAGGGLPRLLLITLSSSILLLGQEQSGPPPQRRSAAFWPKRWLAAYSKRWPPSSGSCRPIGTEAASQRRPTSESTSLSPGERTFLEDGRPHRWPSLAGSSGERVKRRQQSGFIRRDSALAASAPGSHRDRAVAGFDSLDTLEQMARYTATCAWAAQAHADRWPPGSAPSSSVLLSAGHQWRHPGGTAHYSLGWPAPVLRLLPLLIPG